MANIQASYNWAIEVCNRDNVGYSQTYRNERTIKDITYYDCSSFIFYALIAGGWPLLTSWGTWPFTTSNMGNCLLDNGFSVYPPNIPWLAGDILLKTGHTEMAFDGTRTMGAHTSKVALEDQVSIVANDNRDAGWYALYRYGAGAVAEWIKGNRYLGQADKMNNVTIIQSYLTSKGWTLNAIAAVVGNMDVESTINPGLWQSFDVSPNRGYGLVQWTPSTKYTDWAISNGYAIDDGSGQLVWLDEEMIPSGEWLPVSAYPITYSDFKTSNASVDYLCQAFIYNFERPGNPDVTERVARSYYWYNWMMGNYVPPPNPTPMPDWRKKMPLYMYLRRF